MAEGKLYVQLLGEPGLVFPSGTQRLPSDKRAYLLTYLACAADWVSRDRLSRLFWPDHDVSEARHNLRQLLKRTRSLSWSRELETAGEGSDQRLRWMPASDLSSLEEALAVGDRDRAVTLYRGPLLEGVKADDVPEFASWLGVERCRIESRFRDGMLAHAESLIEDRRHAAAVEILAMLLRIDPLDEEALRAYLVAAAGANNRRGAIEEYRRFAARLGSEFSLEPTAATERLIAQIVEGRSGIEPVPSGAAASRARAVSDAGASSALAPTGRFKAAPSSPMVGRELELADLGRLLGGEDCRLLSVTGPGGVGKSRLVMQAYEELAAGFESGAVVVPLGPESSAAALAAVIAQAMALPAGGRPLEAVVGAIGEKRLLLILDDLDGVDDVVAPITELLSRCRRLSILTTSRERLNLAAERVLPLEGLAYPPAGTAVEDLLAYDAVRLFFGRAQWVRPDFYLTESDAPHLIAICAQMAGLPLGIELAAAWVRLLSCAQIDDELHAGLDLLDRSPSDVHERHRSVRASFEHSWRRLTLDEQHALSQLTVFKGGFDAVDARLVAETPLVVLAALVDKSLLRVEAAGRFAIHPLLHRFAGEKLGQAEMRGARDSHSLYYLRRLESLAEPKDDARRESIAWLARGFEDVAEAWRWASASAATQEPDRERSLARSADWSVADLAHLSWSLVALCEVLGRYGEGADLLGVACQASAEPAADAASALGTLMIQRAWLLARIGRLSDARADADRGIELLGPRSKSSRAHRVALNTSGSVALQEGRYTEAEVSFERALRLAEVRGAAGEMADFLGNLGVARQLQGDRQGAAERFRRQLAIRRESGDSRGVVLTLSNLGNVLRLIGDREGARSQLEEGLDLALRNGVRTVLPNLRINLGVLAYELGEHAHASEHFKAALENARDVGRPALEANALHQLGRIALEAREPLVAQDRFARALNLVTAGGNLAAVLDNLAGLAWVRSQLEDRSSAGVWARIAAEHPASSPGTRSWAGELLDLLASGHAPTSEIDTAVEASVIGQTVEDVLKVLEVGGSDARPTFYSSKCSSGGR